MSGGMSGVTGFAGLPYLAGGRTRQGCDCYGLVRLVMEEAGIMLPPHAGLSPRALYAASRAIKQAAAGPEWRPVALNDRQAFDVVLMSHALKPGLTCHVGVIFGPARKVLHSEAGVDAHYADPRHPSIAQRIRAVLRHENFGGGAA